MDTNNIDFNALWSQQKAIQPNPSELYNKINQFKKTNLRRLIITNLLLIATSAFILFIWVYYQPQLLTTKIGIVLTVLAMAIFLIAYNRSIRNYQDLPNADSNADYLQKLKAIKAKQQLMHTTILNVYFILLSTGIGLYMYEYTERMTLTWGIVTYAITAFWILLNWFYFRPKQIKKERTKLNEIMESIEAINMQLRE